MDTYACSNILCEVVASVTRAYVSQAASAIAGRWLAKGTPKSRLVLASSSSGRMLVDVIRPDRLAAASDRYDVSLTEACERGSSPSEQVHEVACATKTHAF